MSDLNREVAGLRCRDVLARLADYVDGDLDAQEVERVEAHLRGCDHCEKFGGEYRSLVGALREGLRNEADGSDVRTRLRRRMSEVWTGEGK